MYVSSGSLVHVLCMHPSYHVRCSGIAIADARREWVSGLFVLGDWIRYDTRQKPMSKHPPHEAPEVPQPEVGGLISVVSKTVDATVSWSRVGHDSG